MVAIYCGRHPSKVRATGRTLDAALGHSFRSPTTGVVKHDCALVSVAEDESVDVAWTTDMPQPMEESGPPSCN
ncbi:unnamed protein product [Danaus chrysippus]|uniref:(African queen) hypothetical protein n=1 Tax=Danaus chrysippus TaxID=151541 RepID=A0A8J2QP68_9NEOP|nr:unnamed protein product [Danaus chrysippus]